MSDEDEIKRLTEEGDKWFGQGQILYNEDLILRAEVCYTKAIELGPRKMKHELYVRRSAARTARGDHVRAVNDAETAISICCTWTVAYARKGFALAAQSRFLDAMEAYKNAKARTRCLAMMEKEIAQVKNTYDTKYEYLIEKLKSKPHTSDWLNDPEYLENVKKIIQGSWYLQEYVNKCGDTPDWRLFYADSIVSGLDKYVTISGKSEVVKDSRLGSQDKCTLPLKAIEL